MGACRINLGTDGISRRGVLRTGAFGATILFAGGCDLISPDISEARAPWDAAGESFGDPRLDALAYAVLAPSPHNRQPWVIELHAPDEVLVRAAPERLLPETDPYNRQVVIGFGCFHELLRQAAAEAGYALETGVFPEGEPQPLLDDRPIFRARFVKTPDIERDALFGYALQRRTTRVPFNEDPVDAETLNRLDTALRPDDGEFEWANDAANVTTLKALCKRAWRIEANSDGPHKESARLTRIGRREVVADPDGISLYGRDIEALRLGGVLSRDSIAEIGSRAHREMIAFYERAIDASQAFGWLTTDPNDRADQLRAGAGWIRLNLAATREGLAMQPLSQALQEFPEMAAPYAEIHEFVGARPSTCVQGLFRFGNAPPPPASPRWPIQSRLAAS
ncbi:MAG: twin-arginine translocation pathway signal protein [Pseudomonadota bacterium]